MKNAKLLNRQVATAFYGSFSNLRAIQESTITPLLSGENLVLTSGTGSGKTEAVMAPLISKYWRSAIDKNKLFLLYIAPTKALVNDLYKRLFPPLSSLGLTIGIRHGDRDDLKRKSDPNVLITTPESLDVLLFRRDQALDNIKVVVIDEVHLLYNTQRGLQLSILLRRLSLVTKRSIQWVALSATVGSLPNIRDFLVGKEVNAVFLDYPPTRTIDSHIIHVKTLNEFVLAVERLVSGRPAKLLVFVNSRRECESIAGALQESEKLRASVFTHYSSLSSEVRLNVEKKFSSLNAAICIATSTLELGIDIGDIDAVLLWGIPDGVDSLLQRIGRSNRRSKKTNVVCVVPDSSTQVNLDTLHFITLVDAASKGELIVQEPYELFGAFGQQCLSVIASGSGRFTRVSELQEMVDYHSCFSREIIDDILSELAHNGLLKRHGYKNQYGADEQLYQLVDMRLIYGNYGIASQMVDLYFGSQHLGEVPAVNLLRLKNNCTVRFSGRNWRVIKMSSNGIFLEPTKITKNIIDFTYGGGKLTSAPGIINKIWSMLHFEQIPLELLAKGLKHEITLYTKRIKCFSKIYNIPYVDNTEGIIYYTFAGNIVNRAICLLSKQVVFETDDYSIHVKQPIDWSAIPVDPKDFGECFDMLYEETSKQSIYQKQLPVKYQKQEYLQSWLKDEDIPKVLKRLSTATPVLLPSNIEMF